MIDLISYPVSYLVLGALAIFLRPNFANTIGMLSIISSMLCLLVVSDSQILKYKIMSFDNVFYEISDLSFLFCVVFLIIGLFGKIFSFYRENSNEKGYVLLYIASALGVILSGDFLTLYVFWEAMAITSTFVIWSTRNQLSLDSGNRYIILHLIGGLILLIGLIGLYGQTYNLTIREISLNTWYSWFILIGLLLNAGAPPFSQWIPDAYPEGSYSSSVFLSAYTTKTSVYVLIVTFAGNSMLIYVGIYMILYGIVYALLENDIRRILSYSIVNQVGFMIVGIGIGTELAINGTSAHAFSHIIYKGLLLMSAGSVLYVTGKRKCTDVGGLYKTMPITAACGIIGAFAISAFPFTSGFISKSMIVESSYIEGLEIIWYFLLIGSAGVFLHAGIKFPWFVFFHRDKKLEATDPPIFMTIPMVSLSFLCIILGIFPNLLYALLPYSVDYVPYTGNHVVSQLHLLLFSGLAFFMALKYLERTLTITLDIDYLYRRNYALLRLILSRIVNYLPSFREIFRYTKIDKKLYLIENTLLNQSSISIMLSIITVVIILVFLLNI